MSEPFKLTRVPSLKTVDAFREHVHALGVEIPCDDAMLTGEASPLTQPVPIEINGKRPGNRFAVQPMEGWDGTTTGGSSPEMVRRWQRFGQSGAKVIYGGEAMAVRADGRANPNQLILDEANLGQLAELREALEKAHQEKHGRTDDLAVGFQLTHSGRFCRPNDKLRAEPIIAHRHPILDRRLGITTDDPVLSDDGVARLIEDYIRAAGLAWKAGADFADLKHCHGYLLHEFLGAHTRPGPYGGSFENRTRILREIVAGIRASGNPIALGVRLSAFDFVPFRPDPAKSSFGKPGPGIPEDFSHCLPYRYGFGVNPNNPVEYDLTEPLRFAGLLGSLGVKLLNVSGGSPYYNPHVLRPAAYPPSDGYQPAHDPLIDVARHLRVTKALKAAAPAGLAVIGSGYSYLQEYLPQVAQAVVRGGGTDIVGLGRMTLSYPEILADASTRGTLENRLLCRTFSDCTTAPRNGLISGCYPLDKYYAAKPEAQRLKELKRAVLSI